MNITNFVLFVVLSFGLDVNDILREDVFVNSYQLFRFYWFA